MATGEKGLLSVFRHPIFTLIWSAAAISNVGNWMEGVAQGWAVIEQTHNPAQSAFLTELLSVADFAPVLVLGLLAGAIADRVNQKAWLFLLQIAACLLGALLAVLGYMEVLTPTLVITVTFAEGIVWALNGPVWMSVVPSLVPRDELELAMAANSMQFNLARLVGPVLAGIVIGISGVKLAFAVNALTFVPVIFAITRLPANRERKSKGDRGIVQDIRSGIRFVRTHQGARRLAIMSIIFMLLSAPVQGLLPVFAHQVLGGGSALYGAMLGMIGLGSVVGAFSLGRIPRYYPRHHLIPLSMCLFAGFGLLYSFSHTTWLSLVLLFFSGIFWLLALNPMNTANQLLATDENRGRIVSVMMICTQGALPVGHLCAAALTHVLSPENVVRCMVGTLLIAAIGFLFLREPAIDQLPKRGRPPESFFAAAREAVTAESHWPASPSESSRISRPDSLE